MLRKSRAIGRPSGEKGIALLTAIIVLFFVSFLGAATIGMTASRMSDVTMDLDSLKAQYVAEAGMSKAQYEMSKGADYDGQGIGNIVPTGFGEGAYSVTHDPQARTLMAVGVVHDVKKVIFIKYATI